MKSYLNPDWLREMYIDKDLSQNSIGKICDVSGSTIHKYLKRFNIPRRKFCGRGGHHCHRWKGGRSKTTQGYIHIASPNHPFANCRGYVPEQRLVVEKHIGHTLGNKFAIHHINEKKDDNRIENLYSFTSESEHQRYHQKLRKGSGKPITKSNLL